MDVNSGFYTLKGYQLNENDSFTPAMEDYLEMICRILKEKESVRIRDLSEKLNVRPSSTSKMVQQLGQLGYLIAERYGDIMLTEKGACVGGYLLYRHDVIHAFLCYLNQTTDELEETEKIEHFLSQNTVHNMDSFLKQEAKRKEMGN